MADSIGNSFLIIVLPLYIGSGVVTGQTFGLGVALITGIILSAFGFLSTILQPVAGYLSDRTGSRRIFIVIGLVILTVANFVYSFAESYALMLITRGVQGIGVAITIPSTVALVNELTDDGSRGNDMGVFNTFRFLGVAAGPLLAGGVIGAGPYQLAGLSITGFDAAFYVAALGSLIGAILIMVFIEDPDPEEQDAQAGSDIGITVFDHDHDTLIDPVFALGLAMFAVSIGLVLIEPLQTTINEHLDQGAQLFSVEFSAFIVSQVLLQTPVGNASDRYGRRPFILGGLVMLVPAMLAQGLVTTPIGMILTRLVQGAAAATAFAPAFALAGDIAKSGNSGTTFAVLTMAFTLGSAVGPLLAGYLVSFGYVVPFAFTALLSGLGALLVYSQVEETHATTAETAGNAQPAGQD